MTEAWLEITAGQGPVECAWAVPRVVEQILAEAEVAGIAISTLSIQPGPLPGTARSVLLLVAAAPEAFIAGWRGTVQWTARSPFRPDHKRKNWFVGVEVLTTVMPRVFNIKDVSWETMRASGPGGQHVNRTESAVRVTHLSTGVQAVASEERSQHRNRALALTRLTLKIAELENAERTKTREQMWKAHQQLQRGNPVRVFGK